MDLLPYEICPHSCFTESPLYITLARRKYHYSYMIDAIGSFLLIFLNTNFEDDEDCRSFVFGFCFESLYYRKYPKIKKANQDSSTHLKLSFSEFNKELDRIIKEYKEEFLYLKYTLLKNLRLPYDTNFFMRYDDSLELTQKDIQNIIQEEKKYYEDKSMKYNETEINGFMEKLNIQFETFGLLFENIDISKYNIPYYFESEDILAIIALMFKEFMSDNHNTIRQCQNCGYYFVPSNLKETKYCNVEYENTGKTCRQIG